MLASISVPCEHAQARCKQAQHSKISNAKLEIQRHSLCIAQRPAMLPFTSSSDRRNQSRINQNLSELASCSRSSIIIRSILTCFSRQEAAKSVIVTKTPVLTNSHPEMEPVVAIAWRKWQSICITDGFLCRLLAIAVKPIFQRSDRTHLDWLFRVQMPESVSKETIQRKPASDSVPVAATDKLLWMHPFGEPLAATALIPQYARPLPSYHQYSKRQSGVTIQQCNQRINAFKPMLWYLD